jgi:hypothetical protein
MRFITIFLMMSGLASAQNLPSAACESLKQERAKYPTSLSSVCSVAGDIRCPLGNMLNTAALKAGLGMAGKDSGYWVSSPAGKVTADILMDLTKTGWDVFRDAENRAEVNCGNSIGKITNRPYVSPVGTTPVPPSTCEQEKARLQYQIDNAKCVIVWP